MPSRVGFDYRETTLDDLPFAARAASEAVPHHPVSEEMMRQRWQSAAMGGSVRRWIVSWGEPVGWLSVVVPEGAEGHGYVNVIVPRASVDELEEVVGFAESRAAEMDVRHGAAHMWQDEEALVAALHARGWRTRRRQRFWRLEVEPVADRLRREHAEVLAKVTGAGLRIVSAAELGGAEAYPAIHRVHNNAQADIPRSVPLPGERYEQWRSWMEPPLAFPDRVWVALDEGRPIGYSYLQFNPNGHVETGFTGVEKEFRGLGVARALKLCTLVQAADLGVGAVETDNDSENAPILHLNEQLGYQEIVGRLELAKDLATAASA